MGIISKFLPKEDRYSAVMLYGMVVALCFNGGCLSLHTKMHINMSISIRL